MDPVVYQVWLNGVLVTTFSGERAKVLDDIRRFEGANPGTVEAREITPES